MNPQNFTPFADPISEDEIKIKLSWTADERTRAALASCCKVLPRD
jgi:hypothetical protein